jgi:hypothetical protein
MTGKQVSPHLGPNLFGVLTCAFVLAHSLTSISSSAIALSPSVVAKDPVTVQDQPIMMSQIEDFDLFNMLDWSFEEDFYSI